MIIHSNGFDPDAPGIDNGNFFGLPCTYENAKIALLGVPWDVTTSYRQGASNGPEAILEASLQIDLFDADFGDFWKNGIVNMGISKSLKKKNLQLRKHAEKVISAFQEGIAEEEHEIQNSLKIINNASEELNEWVYSESWKILEDNKIAGIIGGDHSVPFGLIKALAERNNHFGILQIDAHADLRKAYEGFTYSHASIMYHAMNFKAVSSIVQVGIRDYSASEYQKMKENNFIHWFDQSMIEERLFMGDSWAKICNEIVELLPDKIYISFDIDGLEPACCPSTGTPVPGGLKFYEAVYLLKQLKQKNKKIIGFDICEVAPGEMKDIDAIHGARMLYKLCGVSI